MFDADSKLSSRSIDTTRVNFLSRQVDGKLTVAWKLVDRIRDRYRDSIALPIEYRSTYVSHQQCTPAVVRIKLNYFVN